MMLPSEMMHQCAPNVAPPTIAAIIQVESGGNPFALGVNGPIHNHPHPRTATEAAQFARYYIGLGYSVDLGLMQINSRNLPGLGYSIEQIFDPCNNLRAGSLILSRGYASATRRFGPGQHALKAALSAYNTGNYERGFQNGYVAKYYPGNGLQVVVRSLSPVNLLASARLTTISLPVKASSKPPDIYHADSTVYSLMNEPSSKTLSQSNIRGF